MNILSNNYLLVFVLWVNWMVLVRFMRLAGISLTRTGERFSKYSYIIVGKLLTIPYSELILRKLKSDFALDFAIRCAGGS